MFQRLGWQWAHFAEIGPPGKTWEMQPIRDQDANLLGALQEDVFETVQGWVPSPIVSRKLAVWECVAGMKALTQRWPGAEILVTPLPLWWYHWSAKAQRLAFQPAGVSARQYLWTEHPTESSVLFGMEDENKDSPCPQSCHSSWD